jgi:hypothetical protein
MDDGSGSDRSSTSNKEMLIVLQIYVVDSLIRRTGRYFDLVVERGLR